MATAPIVAGAAVIAVSVVIVVPWLALLASIPLFLSWALTAGFRSWGFLGLVFALVVMVVAACEVVVGLGLIVAIFRRRIRLDVDEIRELRG